MSLVETVKCRIFLSFVFLFLHDFVSPSLPCLEHKLLFVEPRSGLMGTRVVKEAKLSTLFFVPFSAGHVVVLFIETSLY